MPKDSTGKFHFGFGQAAHANAASMKPKPVSAPKSGAEAKPHEEASGHSDGGATELHDHGDGTFHTDGPAGHAEHPSLSHALMHIASHHAPEGKHMHIRSDHFLSDGMLGHTSHHVSEGGEIEGPHEHESGDELAEHVRSVMGDEDSPRDYDPSEMDRSLSGLTA